MIRGNIFVRILIDILSLPAQRGGGGGGGLECAFSCQRSKNSLRKSNMEVGASETLCQVTTGQYNVTRKQTTKNSIRLPEFCSYC